VNRKSHKIKYLLFLFLLVALVGCSKKGDLSSLSPMEIVDKYHTASGEGDYELLRQILFFPPDATEEEINKKVGYDTNRSVGKDTKALTSMIGIKVVSRYEKLIDDNTAEVGIAIKAGIGLLGKYTPVDQVILQKQDGVWKIDYSRNQLTRNQLVDTIKENPKATWPYYYIGMSLQSENPYKAYRFYKKYCELEPDGFFVSDRLLEKFQRFENIEKEEHEQLEIIKAKPENSDGRLSRYLQLCQLFTETGDYAKAEMYLRCAADIIKSRRKLSQLWRDRYENRKEILLSHMKGKADDPLDELLK